MGLAFRRMGSSAHSPKGRYAIGYDGEAYCRSSMGEQP